MINDKYAKYMINDTYDIKSVWAYLVNVVSLAKKR